jgi:hypothetical protein
MVRVPRFELGLRVPEILVISLWLPEFCYKLVAAVIEL